VDSGLRWSGLLVRTPRRLGRCARPKVLLWATDGVLNAEIARRCASTPKSVRRWRSRFAAEGTAAVGRIRAGVAALLCSATMLWKRSCMTGCTRCPRTASACWSTRSISCIEVLAGVCPAPDHQVGAAFQPSYGAIRGHPLGIILIRENGAMPGPLDVSASVHRKAPALGADCCRWLDTHSAWIRWAG